MGLRANLLSSYENMSDMEISDCQKIEIYKRFVFSLSMLHSILKDRKRYGSLGWNVLYEFN